MNLKEIFEEFVKIEGSFTIEEVLWNTTNLTLLLFNADSVTILDVSKRPYHFVALKNISAEAATGLEKLMEKGSTPGNLEIIKKTKEPLLIEDTSTSPYWAKTSSHIRSYLGVPIILGNEVKYILDIDKNKANYFKEEHIEYAKILSKYISNAILKIRLLEEFSSMSTKDTLTELQTRQKLNETLEKYVERYRRYKRKFSCLMLDLDKFKYINDTFGHDVGDTALKSLQSPPKKTCDNRTIIFRFGGDEFIINLKKQARMKGLLLQKVKGTNLK